MMLELMMAKGKKSADLKGMAYALDFSKQNVGDLFLTNQSSNNFQLPVIGTNMAGMGVIDHPSIGRCFQFNGSTYFGIRGDSPVKGLTSGDFDIEFGILRTNSAFLNILSTGNYDATLSSGFTVSMDQFVDPSLQYFIVDRPTTAYDRYYAPGRNNLTYTEYLISQRGNVLTLKNVTSGDSSIVNGPRRIVDDEYLSVGGSMDTNGRTLSGYLKYLRINKP